MEFLLGLFLVGVLLTALSILAIGSDYDDELEELEDDWLD